jgi:hypothetical protein
LSRRRHHSRALRELLRTGIAEPTPEILQQLENLNTKCNSAIPPCPDDAPLLTIIDEDVLRLLIRSRSTGNKGGCSGWTAEIIGVLAEDPVCFQGILCLIQDIANADIDPHSRDLLCTSLLLGIPKPNSGIRPLALGEEFLKLANLYCYKLNGSEYADIFEPVQYAMKSRGGCEKAIQSIQATLEQSDEHVSIQLDITNAYGTADRAKMLEAVYANPALINSWKLYDLSYSRPSQLLVRKSGRVVHAIVSENGVKQGDVLATLGFCTLIQPALEEIDEHYDVTIKAIADDIAISGHPNHVFKAYGHLVQLLAPLGLLPNQQKSFVQAPHDVTEMIADLAGEYELPIKIGNSKYVGSMIGFDIQEFRSFLAGKFDKLRAIEQAICDPDMPALYAIYYTRLCVWTKPIYLLRTLPIQVTLDMAAELRDSILGILLQRLELPSPLPDTANFCFQQPVKQGGMGFRESGLLALAARWASLALAAPQVDSLQRDPSCPSPLIRERAFIYNTLRSEGLPATDLVYQGVEPSHENWELLPANLGSTAVHYVDNEGQHVRHLQRMVTLSLEAIRREAFLSSGVCSELDLIRIRACKQKCASFWLIYPNPYLTEQQVKLIVRIRAGLPPVDDRLPTHCVCKEKFLLSRDPYHAFSCSRLKRRSINTRHDMCQNLIAAFARSNSCIVHCTPKQYRSLVPDGDVVFAYSSDFFDVSGTHPLAPSIVDSAINCENKARQMREATKQAKYFDYSKSRDKGFVPFVLETYGGIGEKASKFLLKIENEGSQGLVLGITNPFRLKIQQFLIDLSATWQAGNANIILEWLRMLRSPIGF